MQQGNLIPWSAARKLSWDDFKASPDPHSSNAALTSSTINIEFGYDDDGLQYSIKCNFDRTRSWVRIRNNEVLAHEQGHFDIAEIHARKLGKAMHGYRFNSRTVSKDVNNIYDSIMNLHKKTQNQYDQESDFSRNRVNQESWLKKVEKQLAELQPFANYTAIVNKGE